MLQVKHFLFFKTNVANYIYLKKYTGQRKFCMDMFRNFGTQGRKSSLATVILLSQTPFHTKSAPRTIQSSKSQCLSACCPFLEITLPGGGVSRGRVRGCGYWH